MKFTPQSTPRYTKEEPRLQALGSYQNAKRLLLFFILTGGPRQSDGLVDFADLEAGEAADGDVLTQRADLRGDELAHADGLLLNERLIQKADLLIEL